MPKPCQPTAPAMEPALPQAPSNLESMPVSAGVARPAPPRGEPAPPSPPAATPHLPASLATAPAFPSFSSAPSDAGAPSPAASSFDGLKGFVAGIRQLRYTSSAPRVGLPAATLSRQPFSDGYAPAGMGSRPLDVPAIRKDFPILRQRVHGKPLAWLDNAATTQKPQCVIDEISRFYEQDNSNIHRAAHTLAARATDAYEKAREKVRTFLARRR